MITIITPTTGKNSLSKLIGSIENQSVDSVHILLWDNLRHGNIENYPEKLNGNHKRYNIVIPTNIVKGKAAGSSLRAIGLMAANTPFVTFADDDVWYDEKHLWHLMKLVENVKETGWGYCRRKIWNSDGEYLGIDNFESVGALEDRIVPYEMVDNNCMIFSRELGSQAAPLYRETEEYNDDRLMYSFLKQYGGTPFISKSATINQICPEHLREQFERCCTK